MPIKIKLCAAVSLLTACSDGTLPKSTHSEIVQTPYIVEAQRAAVKKFSNNLSFISMYENNEAVCGEVKKSEGEAQQFIYVRKTFLLQEVSPSGEWEALWVSECDDG